MRKTTILGLLIGCLATPLMAWSQATSSLMIPVNSQTVVKVRADLSQMDLLKEIRKLKPALNSVPNIEIQLVRVEAKSNVGGAQIFLNINSAMVAAAVVETNPNNFGGTDPRSFERFELKNIERSRLSAASLQFQNVQSLKVNSVEVVFGAIQETVIFGKYAAEQASIIGGNNDNKNTKPSQNTVDQIRESYYGFSDSTDGYTAPAPTYPTQVRPQARPQPTAPAQRPAENSRCMRNYAGQMFCVGDIVRNAWGFDQRIISVNARLREVTVVSEMYSEPYTRSVDMLSR